MEGFHGDAADGDLWRAQKKREESPLPSMGITVRCVERLEIGKYACKEWGKTVFFHGGVLRGKKKFKNAPICHISPAQFTKDCVITAGSLTLSE